MTFQWWSDPFEESARPHGAPGEARRLNFKFDRRQMLVADDGAGGWVSLTGSPESAAALMVRGAPAGDIMAAELSVAAWSDEDRLPAAPPAHDRGFGSIDARVLTESSIGSAILETLATLNGGERAAAARRGFRPKSGRRLLALQVCRSHGVIELLEHRCNRRQ